MQAYLNIHDRDTGYLILDVASVPEPTAENGGSLVEVTLEDGITIEEASSDVADVTWLIDQGSTKVRVVRDFDWSNVAVGAEFLPIPEPIICADFAAYQAVLEE